MTDNYPEHCLDDDGEYLAHGDMLDVHRIDYELYTGVYDPTRIEDRSEEWLLTERAAIVARLAENDVHPPYDD